VSDQRGNAILVSANVHFFPQILKLIQDVDAPSDKVTIQARIVQVSSDFLDKLGVRWSPNGSQVFTADDYDNSILASGSGSYQKGFGGNTSVNTPSSPGSSVVQTLASLRSGVVSSTISIDYLVQFLRKNTDATVLGEPCITIDDNEMGKLFVGQQVPVPGNTQVSSVGSQNTSIMYQDVGVTLEVTPHINTDGDVQLKIHAESSTVDSGPTVLGGDVFDTENFRTEVTAKNGQNLVLGGIIQKQSSEIIRKTPFLGSIPGLGWAFKKKDKSTQEVELMVFLHPTVIHTAEDAVQLERDIEQKNPLIEKWQRDSEKSKAR
jgi:general secretion pathway protein D